jgi:hypothetical protein
LEIHFISYFLRIIEKMKDYIDYDEDIQNEEEDEDDEKILNDDNDEFYNMRPSNKNRKNKKFDESNFDVKVAKSIVAIHTNAKRNSGSIKFSNWVDKNLPHLQALHSLSNLSCSPIDFYTYIYENSK